jgi:general stress protein CsbA
MSLLYGDLMFHFMHCVLFHRTGKQHCTVVLYMFFIYLSSQKSMPNSRLLIRVDFMYSTPKKWNREANRNISRAYPEVGTE